MPNVIVKICGVTTLEDALTAARAGADMLGLNFYKKSPRYLEVEAAVKLTTGLRAELGAACPLLVGVFVNDIVSRVSRMMEVAGLNFAQLSGDESMEMVRELHGVGYKAIRPRTAAEAGDDAKYYLPSAPTDARLPSLLVDAAVEGQFGGTGEQARVDVVLAVVAAVPRVMLAGGLTPDNVASAVAVTGVWGVDVASGVEGATPGRKDAGKVAAFVAAARGVG